MNSQPADVPLASASARPRSGRIRRWLSRLLRIMCAVYALWCAGVWFKQDSLLFMPPLSGQPEDRAQLPTGVERLWLNANEGVRVEAWLFVPPATVPGPAARPLIVLFHGNAELIDDLRGRAADYTKRGFAVLCPEYRGYGRSGGKPSQASIVSDSAALVQQALARGDIDGARVIFHGRSLGGGIAAQVAAAMPEQQAPRALILESTFTSVASFSWGFGVPPFLVKHPLRTDRVLASFKGRVLILHGAQDTIINPAHAARLWAIANQRPGAPETHLHLLPGGHNDFPRDPAAYWRAIDEFVGDGEASAK